MFDLAFDLLEQLITSFNKGLHILTDTIPKTEIIIPGGVSILSLFTLTFFIGYIIYAAGRWILI